jgi:hypothetical protein
MAYDFDGFFAAVPGDRESILSGVRRQWPQAKARTVEEPFRGIGVGLILSESDPLANDMDALDAAYERFVAWTRDYPRLCFVWINASCFGGHCIYHGDVVQSGETISTEKGDGALGRLVAHLGVTLGQDEYFEPFVGGYFNVS